MTSGERVDGRRPGMVSALRHRDFRLVAGGQLVSAIGDGILPVAVTLALLRRGDSAVDIGSMLAGRSMAMVLALMIGGVFADRYPRKYLMIVADLVRMGAICMILVALTNGWHAITIALAMLIFGLGEAFFRPAFRGLYPLLLPEEMWQQANAIASLVSRSAAIVGPALGGLLVTLWNPHVAIWIDLVSFGASVLTLALMTQGKGAVHTAGTAWSELADGFRVVYRRRWLRTSIIAGLVQMPLSVAPWFVLLPLVSLAHYDSAAPYAASMSAYAAGAVVGALAASRLDTRLPGIPAMFGVAAFGLVMLSMLAEVPAVVLIGAHLVAGLGLEVYAVLYFTAVQRGVPNQYLGRVTAVDVTFSTALMPIAYAVVGVLVEVVGRSHVLVAGFVACIVTTLPLLAFEGMRKLDFSETPIPARDTTIPVS